jgi:uncharacterized protein (DUF305 family)
MINRDVHRPPISGKHHTSTRSTRTPWRKPLLLAVALLSVLVILLASCGGGQSSEQSGGATEKEIASSTTTEATTEDATAPTSETTDVPQVDEEGGTAVDLDDNRPFDLQFIDQMIVHHQMAIMSSEHMISDSERPELRQLSENIQESQSEQIEQMQAWRDEWYPDAGRTSGMDNGMMGGSMQGEMGGSMQRGMGSDTADAMCIQGSLLKKSVVVAIPSTGSTAVNPL